MGYPRRGWGGGVGGREGLCKAPKYSWQPPWLLRGSHRIKQPVGHSRGQVNDASLGQLSLHPGSATFTPPFCSLGPHLQKYKPVPWTSLSWEPWLTVCCRPAQQNHLQFPEAAMILSSSTLCTCQSLILKCYLILPAILRGELSANLQDAPKESWLLLSTWIHISRS